MYKVDVSNVAQKRTLRPLYAGSGQATPWGGFLDPEWDRSFDIYPGCVMARAYGEVFTPFTGAEGQVPVGLSALFVTGTVASEVTGGGTNTFTVWIGAEQGFFEILAPAFDADADWSFPPGQSVWLTGNATSQLTTDGVTADNAIAELIDVISTDKIVVRLNRVGAAVNTGGS